MTEHANRQPSNSAVSTALAMFQALALAALLSGCVVAAGNRAAPPVEQTLGRQLMDLKEARDTGAMSESEYQGKRRQLLEESR